MINKEAIYELEKEVVYLNKHIKSMRKEFSDNQNEKAIEALERVKMLTEWKFNSIAEVVNYIDKLIKEYGGKNEATTKRV